MNMRSPSSNQIDSSRAVCVLLMAGLSLLLVASVAMAQAPPSTDLYLLAVDSSGDSPQLGLPVNITAREGYDNQPAFTLDGKWVLYTSMRGEQTDIYGYELATAKTRQVTDTPVNEYSPTPMAGGTAFSAIRQDLEGKQFLYRYPLGEGKASLLLPEVEPVGYHGWSGERLLLFVLGEPATLRIAQAGKAGSQVIASNPGRSFQPVPGSGEVACVIKGDDGAAWTIEAVDLVTATRRSLGTTRPEREDFVFGPRGEIWMGDGHQLYRRPARAGAEWQLVKDFEPFGFGDITRMAFDSSGKWLVVVAERKSPEATESAEPSQRPEKSEG